MAGEMWGLKLVAFVVGFLLMVPETMQLRVDHPLYGLVQRINDEEGPFLGILLPDYLGGEKLLTDSGFFVPTRSLVIAGRQFNIGKFRGVNAIYVRAVLPLANVAATVQLLLDTFHMMGIIDWGTCGSTSDKQDVLNVVVPTHVAYTGSWQWQDYEHSLKVDGEVLPSLKFGDYNIPKSGENELASIKYMEAGKYTPNSEKKTFWFYVDPDWLNIANEIEDSDLERCINWTICSDSLPKIIHGLKFLVPTFW